MFRAITSLNKTMIPLLAVGDRVSDLAPTLVSCANTFPCISLGVDTKIAYFREIKLWVRIKKASYCILFSALKQAM